MACPSSRGRSAGGTACQQENWAPPGRSISYGWPLASCFGGSTAVWSLRFIAAGRARTLGDPPATEAHRNGGANNRPQSSGDDGVNQRSPKLAERNPVTNDTLGRQWPFPDAKQSLQTHGARAGSDRPTTGEECGAEEWGAIDSETGKGRVLCSGYNGSSG